MRTVNQPLACYFRCAQRTLHWVFELIRGSLDNTGNQTPMFTAGQQGMLTGTGLVQQSPCMRH
jgi:hypothetical protein